MLLARDNTTHTNDTTLAETAIVEVEVMGID
jgi:hypothetical protein